MFVLLLCFSHIFHVSRKLILLHKSVKNGENGEGGLEKDGEKGDQ